jgi:arabinogalactan oligomer/maltooligosaccharide transport system permease protein
MDISFLPALIELGKLLTVLAAVVGGGLGLIWLNYRIWQQPLYLTMMTALALTLGISLYLYGANGLTAGYFGGLPLLMALYFRFGLKGRYQAPTFFLVPAILGLIFLFLYPLIYEFFLSFKDLSLKTFPQWIATGEVPLAPFYGLQNYIDVFKDRATGQSFIFVFWRTVIWTVINLIFHLTLGVGLAMVLNARGMRGVGIYRSILTLPWIIPHVIAVLVWRADFNESVGFVNQFIRVVNQLVSFEYQDQIIEPLTWLGFETKAWFLDKDALFTASCIVNIWLGVPFMMINGLGALQSIPNSLYEAAAIDGASPWQQFYRITLPMLQPVMLPAALLGAIWTFNNLNVIYLMTDAGRYEGADILVTDLYKQSFTYYRYGFAAAYSFVIFAILSVLTYGQYKLTKSSQ